MNVAILAHEKFPDRAKTAIGLLRYTSDDVVAVLDRDHAGRSVGELVDNVQDAPIVDGMSDLDDDSVDALIIGIAPIGGGFDESWREDVKLALERGCDVIAGLHYFLSEDDEFSALARDYGCELRDVRKPPDSLSVSDGVAADIEAEVILTVGTDCSVGKMTTTMELARRATDVGMKAAVIPTGQTGIMIEGWGIPIDRVISDFTAGAVESMLLELAEEYDYLFVEGQGSIVHPAYSGVTCSILHGSMADALVLCHTAGRSTILGYESVSIPPIPTLVDLYESLSEPIFDTRVVAGALDTHHIEDDEEAQMAVESYAADLGAPATDVVRFGTDEILEAVR